MNVVIMLRTTSANLAPSYDAPLVMKIVQHAVAMTQMTQVVI